MIRIMNSRNRIGIKKKKVEKVLRTEHHIGPPYKQEQEQDQRSNEGVNEQDNAIVVPQHRRSRLRKGKSKTLLESSPPHLAGVQPWLSLTSRWAPASRRRRQIGAE